MITKETKRRVLLEGAIIEIRRVLNILEQDLDNLEQEDEMDGGIGADDERDETENDTRRI